MEIITAIIIIVLVIVLYLAIVKKEQFKDFFNCCISGRLGEYKIIGNNDFVFDYEVNQDQGNEIDEGPDLKNINTVNKKKKKIKIDKIKKYQKQPIKKNKRQINMEPLTKYNPQINELQNMNNTNPNFLEMQFHNDYRDVLTAFNDIAPTQKLIFNQANLPVALTQPPESEVLPIIKEFIHEVNRDVQFNITDYRQSNTGWDELTPDKKMKSGWDAQQDDLGLPTSLYPDPAKRAAIKFIKIDHIEKYVTEFQTKYEIVFIVQKINVDDQMIIKASFVKPNLDVNFERKLFDDLDKDYNKESGFDNSFLFKNDNNYDNLVIEEIFVVGFLTKEGSRDSEDGIGNNNFYNFKGLETNDMIDQKVVMKELINKYRDNNKRMSNFTASLDTSDQEFHNELPELAGYKSYKCMRSIFDDLSGKPIIYD